MIRMSRHLATASPSHKITNATTARYAVELGSDGALRFVANSGNIFFQAGNATIQMHHDTGMVTLSGLDATPVFG